MARESDAEMGDDASRHVDDSAPDFHVDASMTTFGTLTMSVKGELEMSTAGTLLDEFGEWLGIRECIVELSDCDFIDSVGIRALLECRHQIGPDATMRLVGVAPHVARVLQRAGIDQIAGLESAAHDATAKDRQS